jgi:hypothetical protein
MKPKQAIAEANGILRQVAGVEAAVSHVSTVVQVAVALDLNENTVRGHVRGRPFGVPLSGTTARGHRGFCLQDVLALRMGRYAMKYCGIRPEQVQKMVDGILGVGGKQSSASRRDVWVMVSNDACDFLSEADLGDEARVETFFEKKSRAAHIFNLRQEICETTERLAAMLENRPYVEPEIVRADRESKSESMKRALTNMGKLMRSVRFFTSGAALAGGLSPYKAALVGLMSQSLNDSTVEKLIGIIEARFIDRVPEDRRNGSLCFLNVNHDEPECLFVPYGTRSGYPDPGSQTFVLPWGFILDAVDAHVEGIAKGVVQSATPELSKKV